MPRSPKEFADRFDGDGPQYEPRDPHAPEDAAMDNEIDFDDESDDDQLPLDEVEAIELGVNLDDPELEPAPDLDD